MSFEFKFSFSKTIHTSLLLIFLSIFLPSNALKICSYESEYNNWIQMDSSGYIVMISLYLHVQAAVMGSYYGWNRQFEVQASIHLLSYVSRDVCTQSSFVSLFFLHKCELFHERTTVHTHTHTLTQACQHHYSWRWKHFFSLFVYAALQKRKKNHAG